MRSLGAARRALKLWVWNVDGMGVICRSVGVRLVLIACCAGFAVELGAQEQAPKKPATTPKSASEPPKSINPVTITENGWPVVAGDTPLPTPLAETRIGAPRSNTKPLQDGAAEPAVPLPPAAPQRLASGMQFDSPMHDVFRGTGVPGNLQRLGGVVVSWRLRVHGPHGEDVGIREMTHKADLRQADHDRIEHQDGRVYSRLGSQLTAQRGGLPWDPLLDEARAELDLFGLHLRMPWCYGDGKAYSILTREVVTRRGEKLIRLQLERAPSDMEQVFGPQVASTPRDRFELLFEPKTGLPRELVHRFACSGQQRRVLLEDWREVGGVRMPHRRIYVDDAMRPMTTIEILRIEPERVGEADFRLR